MLELNFFLRMSLFLSHINDQKNAKLELKDGLVFEIARISKFESSNTQSLIVLGIMLFAVLFTTSCILAGIRNIELRGGTTALEFDSVARVGVNIDQLKSCSAFLKSIKRLKPNGGILINHADHELDLQDLQILVDISKRVPVLVDWKVGLSIAEIPASSEYDLGNIEIIYSDAILIKRPPIGQEKRTRFLQFVMGNNIAISYRITDNQQLYWDVAFAKGKAARPSYYEPESRVARTLKSTDVDFAQLAQQYHWSFDKIDNDKGSSGQGEPAIANGLFLPSAEDIFATNYTGTFSKFKQIETLSFDLLWLNRVGLQKEMFFGGAGLPEKSISGLEFAFFTNLERLDLDRNCTITNKTFLRCIPKIEYLQVKFDRQIANGIDFSNCKNLKTLVYFGTPSKTAMKSLSKLGSLESVTILELDDGSKRIQGLAKQIEQSVPGVKVTVVAEDKSLPIPPTEFIEHVKKTSKLIRQKYGVSTKED